MLLPSIKGVKNRRRILSGFLGGVFVLKLVVLLQLKDHPLQLRPDQASARQQLGLNLLILDRCEEAARELAEAARLDPRDPDTLSHLAYCELKLGRPEDARSHAEAALALSPENDLANQLVAALRATRPTRQ